MPSASPKASGFVRKPEPEEVTEAYRIFVVVWCKDRHPEYTLGQMLEMARCLQDFDREVCK